MNKISDEKLIKIIRDYPSESNRNCDNCKFEWPHGKIDNYEKHCIPKACKSVFEGSPLHNQWVWIYDEDK